VESTVQNQNVKDGPHWELCGRIITVFYEVYNELGYGYVEKIYQLAMERALGDAGLRVFSEVPMPVYFRDQFLYRFRLDTVVESAVILELKACSALRSEHEAQLISYLRASTYEAGLLFNFGPAGVEEAGVQ
jgi:GxxExxY protein